MATNYPFNPILIITNLVYYHQDDGGNYRVEHTRGSTLPPPLTPRPAISRANQRVNTSWIRYKRQHLLQYLLHQYNLGFFIFGTYFLGSFEIEQQLLLVSGFIFFLWKCSATSHCYTGWHWKKVLHKNCSQLCTVALFSLTKNVAKILFLSLTRDDWQ